ncbi:large subunit ribosomal protein L13 [Lebetimonas natsushimae]|uniref:Large ribosomal subunit protein uL13 n=1 Tax=Lebetimonas natsushimae TaxID=1936991 RepID=A0A292Y9Y8_9BACT|nr:50S ribosomal protein L13 [Lebetimonas natsushimae]GAX87712.1 large subunit ribosomal protein L13 [Lebetimonas natsushimae]
MKFTKSIREEDVKRDWILIDAKDKIFGRVITEIATYLRGKHKPYYTPHVDCGDYVVVINADKVRFSTNKKLGDKYYKHTGYFGSVKEETVEKLLKNNPEKLFKLATRGMLPKTKLGRKMLKKLKVYAGENHPHTAQVKGN